MKRSVLHVVQNKMTSVRRKTVAALAAFAVLAWPSNGAWAQTGQIAAAGEGANELVLRDLAEATTGEGSGPTVWVQLKKPEPDKGVVKLARYESRSAQAAANAVVVTTHYTTLCTEPCGVQVDTSERPIYFFVRDGKPISDGFRLHETSGEVTLKVKPHRQGLWYGGLMLTGFLILPAGIPMMVAGRGRVWAAQGKPADGQTFVRLKRQNP